MLSGAETAATTDAAGELRAKVERVQGILDAHDGRALQLTRAESLSWLLGGARVTVPYAGPPVCTATVHRDGAVVVTAHANELARLRDEELPAGVELRAVPWTQALPVAPGALSEADHLAELRAARAPLLARERARYGRLGADLARAVTAVMHSTRPGDTEHALASRLVRAAVGIGAEPVVVLAAGDARTGIPHPLPTGAQLGRRAMAVIGARRHGLIANLTRWVSFDGSPHPAEPALREVEADAFAATQPGRALNDVLAEIARSYERHGLGAHAWLAHHQGGPTGYSGRDPKATPATGDRIVSGQAFAWNPWVPGAKLEDTVIVDDDGIHPLTDDPAWPAAPIRGILRPLTLTLPGRTT